MIDIYSKMQVDDGYITHEKGNIKIMSKRDYLDYCIELLEHETNELVIFDILVKVVEEFDNILIDFILSDLEQLDTFEMCDFVNENYVNILNLLYFIRDRLLEEGGAL